MEAVGGKKTAQNFYFEPNSFDKGKMALGFKSKSRFVYSLEGGNHFLLFVFNKTIYILKNKSISDNVIIKS